MGNQAPERVVNGIKTRVLHGKDYVEVNTRVQILHNLIKAGEIQDFEMIESEPREIAGQVYWRVSARINGKLYIGNAEVKFDASKNTPDGTNPISCAETSAFGRMLGLAGLGTLESIASYEEVARGQPFTKIVEQSGGQIVESANAPRLQEAAPPLGQVKEHSERLYPGKWDMVKKNALKADVTDEDITPAQALRIHKALLYWEAKQAEKEAQEQETPVEAEAQSA